MNIHKIKSSKSSFLSTSDPNVWGPSFWLSLHTGSIKYPLNASPIFQHRMKSFILGIPYILPCDECRQHALAFIDSRASVLDNICSGREELFKFFVDFHNLVNARHNKPIVSYKEAYELYTGKANVFSSISYN